MDQLRQLYGEKGIPIGANDEWLFRASTIISKDGEETATIHAELTPNIEKAKMGVKTDILDVLSLITDTPFVSFIISTIFGYTISSVDELQYIVNADTTGTEVVGIQIIVPEAHRVPEWINNARASLQMDSENTTKGFLPMHPNSPVTQTVRTYRHTYEPLIEKEIMVSLNDQDAFRYLDLPYIFFNVMVPEFNAVGRDFYGFSNESNIMKAYSEKQILEFLDIDFDIACGRNMFVCRCYCRPSLFISDDMNVYKYHYLGYKEAIMYKEPIYEQYHDKRSISSQMLCRALTVATASLYTQIFYRDMQVTANIQYHGKLAIRIKFTNTCFNLEGYMDTRMHLAFDNGEKYSLENLPIENYDLDWLCAIHVFNGRQTLRKRFLKHDAKILGVVTLDYNRLLNAGISDICDILPIFIDKGIVENMSGRDWKSRPFNEGVNTERLIFEGGSTFSDDSLMRVVLLELKGAVIL